MSARILALSVVGVDAALGQHLGELLRRHVVHAMRHLGKARIDFTVRNLDLVALPDLDLQLLVDEFLDDFVARGGLVGGELDEFHPLLDVVGGDDVAIDDQRHLLGARQVRCRQRREHASDGNGYAIDSSVRVSSGFHHVFTSAEPRAVSL